MHYKTIIKNFLILSVFLFAGQSVKAAHIVGGDVYYTFVRFNSDSSRVTYRIDINMYRDKFSDGAPFDAGAKFGIFRQNLNGTWSYFDERPLNPGPVSDVPATDDPCVDEPSNVGVEETQYSFEYTFEVINTAYMIAYQRCCRNNSISNIFDPGDTGAAFSVVISSEAMRLGNSSPQFREFPPIFICGNNPLDFDHSAADIDGDVIRYNFCAPKQAGGIVDAQTGGDLGCCDCVRPEPLGCLPDFDDVVFRPPFTSLQPLGGSPTVSIDPNTGLISGTPVIQGQFVVGVCAQEFRNGVLISEIRRDFQFNVVECIPQVIASFDYEIINDNTMNDECQMFEINSCGENTVFIKNDSQIPSEIFAYHWTFFNPDGSVLDDQDGGTELRDIEVTFPGIGQYDGVMILNEGTECSDTACFFVNIFPSIEADFEFEYDTCVAGTVQFTDLSFTGADQIESWSWSFEGREFSDDINPAFQFDEPGSHAVVLRVEDNNECVAEITKVIDYFPVPQLIVVEPTTFVGCSPADIFFSNLSTPIDESYDILWDFGDGNTSGEISPTHTYLEPGNYSVSIDIVSPVGCTTSASFDSWIRILQGPTADFDYSPDEPNNFTDEVRFTDLSSNAGAWQWDFAGLSTSFSQNPSYAFPDTGFYDVVLTVFHPITNCPDTMIQTVEIRPLVTLYMPNAFTPNNDNKNDDFRGKGYTAAISDYTMTIWNRWGELVFESNDPEEGWNGKVNNAGKNSPQGVYVYKVVYTDPRGNKKMLDGHLTLLR